MLPSLAFLKTATLKDSLASMTGQVSAGILGAVFFAVSARLLGAEEFGIFSLALATAVIIKDIIDPGINSLLLRFVPASEPYSKALSFIKYALFLKIAYFAIVFPVLLLLNRPFSLIVFQRLIFGLIPLTLLLSLALSAGYFISGIFQSHKRFFADAIFTFSQPLLRLVILIWVYFQGTITVQSLLVVNITAYLIVTLIALFFITTRFLQVSIPKLTKSQSHSFLPPIMLSTATGTLTDRLNLYITNYFANPISVGYLSAATQLFVPTKQIAGSLSNVFGSRFASFTNSNQTSRYLKLALGFSTFLGLGLISTSLIARPLILLVFGQEFIPAIPIFRLLTLAFALFLIQTPFTSMLLYAKSRPDLLAMIAVLQLIVTALANLILVPTYGTMGAALALILVMATSLLATLFAALTATTKS